MSKTKKVTGKAKVVKPEVEEPIQSVDVGKNTDTESIISENTNVDISEEKESLKSPEIDSRGLTFEEANDEMDKGICVRLPEWKGFWFKQIAGDGQIYVLTKDGEVVDTPYEDFKSRNDWEVAVADEKQSAIIEEFWSNKKFVDDNKKVIEDQNNLKALYHSAYTGSSPVKLKTPITVVDLIARKNLPSDVTYSSEFLLENGHVFSMSRNSISNEDRSVELSILNKQK